MVPIISAPEGRKKLYSNDGKQYPQSIANLVWGRLGATICPLIGAS